jgi:hypothetical protein
MVERYVVRLTNSLERGGRHWAVAGEYWVEERDAIIIKENGRIVGSVDTDPDINRAQLFCDIKSIRRVLNGVNKWLDTKIEYEIVRVDVATVPLEVVG